VQGLSADPRLVGVAIGGSFTSDSMDAFSDLDLVIAVEPEHQVRVLAERQRIAGSLTWPSSRPRQRAEHRGAVRSEPPASTADNARGCC
jgi:hypothetical protein